MARLFSLRPWVRRFIPEALKLGLNTVQFQGIIKGKWGRFYRRVDFLDDWREFSGRAKKRDPLRAIKPSYRVTDRTITITEGMQRAKYNWNYDVTGYDTFLEKEVTIGMTVSSETVLTMEQALEKVGEQWIKYKEDIISPQFEIESVTQKKA